MSKELKVYPCHDADGINVFEFRENLFCIYNPEKGDWNRFYPDPVSSQVKTIPFYKTLGPSNSSIFLTSDGLMWYLHPSGLIESLPSSINLDFNNKIVLKSKASYDFYHYSFDIYTFGEKVAFLLDDIETGEPITIPFNKPCRHINMMTNDLLKDINGTFYRFIDDSFQRIDFNWRERIKHYFKNFFKPVSIKEVFDNNEVLVFGSYKDFSFIYKDGSFHLEKITSEF